MKYHLLSGILIGLFVGYLLSPSLDRLYDFVERKALTKSSPVFTGNVSESGSGKMYKGRIEFSPSTSPKRGVSPDIGGSGALMRVMYNHDYSKADIYFFLKNKSAITPTFKIVTDQGEEVLTWEEFKERLAPKEKVSFFPTNPVRPGSGREYIFLDDDGSAFVGEYKITFSRIRKH